MGRYNDRGLVSLCNRHLLRWNSHVVPPKRLLPPRTPNKTLAESCTNSIGGPPAVAPGGNGCLFNGMVAPFLNMTIWGALWYQGENDCFTCVCEGECDISSCGNILNKTGYGCMTEAMLKAWRGAWSVEAGTTDPEFPFGREIAFSFSAFHCVSAVLIALFSRPMFADEASIVAIAVVVLASEEGECGDGAFRWAQTGNFGVLPSPQLPNTFAAQVCHHHHHRRCPIWCLLRQSYHRPRPFGARGASLRKGFGARGSTRKIRSATCPGLRACVVAA